jgi:hypothetical protein
MTNLIGKAPLHIYRSGGPPSLSVDHPTGNVWAQWWSHLVSIGGDRILVRPHCGDLLLVLAFFALWAHQVTDSICSATSIEDAISSLSGLATYLLSGLQGKKRKAGEMLGHDGN